MAKPTPRARSASTALPIARAWSGSSQLPKSSTWSAAVRSTTACATRSVTKPVTRLGSPMISGSSSVVDQAMTTCGSDWSSALARSARARSAIAWSRASASVSARRRRVRTSMMAVTTAKHRIPSVSPRAAISWLSSCETADT
jgi:hypothetical protein